MPKGMCSRCASAPARPGQRYCAAHHAEAQRAYRRRISEELRPARERKAAERAAAKAEAALAREAARIARKNERARRRLARERAAACRSGGLEGLAEKYAMRETGRNRRTRSQLLR